MNEAARLMCDLALDPSLRSLLRENPEEVISQYSLTDAERKAVLDGSGDAMLALLGHAIGGSSDGLQAIASPQAVPRERAVNRPEVSRGQPVDLLVRMTPVTFTTAGEEPVQRWEASLHPLPAGMIELPDAEPVALGDGWGFRPDTEQVAALAMRAHEATGADRRAALEALAQTIREGSSGS